MIPMLASLWASTVAVALMGIDDAGATPFTVEHFREHAAYLASDELEGRDVGAPGGYKASEYVRRQFERSRLEPIGNNGTYFQEFPSERVRGRSVLGLWPGRGALAPEYVIVTAHHDHLGLIPDASGKETDRVFNGADDNASGVAAMLLIAEALSGNGDRLPASYRSVIFAAFDAEERGLLGSKYYVEHPLRPLKATVAVLNLDMVGRMRKDRLYANDADSSRFLIEALHGLESATGLRIETRGGGAGRSDQAPFLERRIPGIQFQTGVHDQYHRVNDELQSLNLEGGVRVADLVYRLLRQTIELPGPITFQTPDPAYDIQRILGVVGRLGLIPEVNTQPGRYPRMNLVIPGSPAAKAGLKAGDQVAALNGKTFERVEDAIGVFAELKFDRDLIISVLRGDQKIDVTVPASVFLELAGPKVQPRPGGDYDVMFRSIAPRGVNAVYLAGTFNDWKPDLLKMNGPDDKGSFTTTLVLKKGIYEYKFVDDGKTWRSDPSNMNQVGPDRNSVIWVGTDR
jgi:membrane-associated protease RseP (regulator of RpoE activity)